MFSNLNFLDYVIILSGALVCLKRIAEMQRYHELRVVILTSILSVFVILFFIGFGLTFGNPGCNPPIQMNQAGADHFTCTEM
jgi:hypothetical protein